MAGARLGILADDLTGALDAAAPFPGRGMSTFVSTGTQPPPGAAGQYEVLSLNMDSRRREIEEARQAAVIATDNLLRAGFHPLLHKVDSTMRGHPGLEAAATASTIGAEVVLLAPAYPTTRRTVVDGHLLVRGVPVSRTDVGMDPLSPVPDSSIVELARRSSGLEVVPVPLSDVRGGPERLSALLDGVGSRGPVIAVADAESESDLSALVTAAARSGRKILLAGSAGLAAALAGAYGAPEPAPTGRRTRLARQPYLVVAGSQREVVRAQVETLRKQARIAVVEMNGDLLLNGSGGAEERHRLLQESKRALRQGRSLALTLDSPQLRGATGGGAGPQLLPTVRDRLASELGKLARAIVSTGVNALVAVGGDTALTTLSALDAGGVVLGSEPMRGVPAGTLHGGALDGAPLVTKGGAFGDEETLLRVFEYLATGRTYTR